MMERTNPTPSKNSAFCDTFFNFMASNDCPVAAGNCLLHYRHSGKKETSQHVSTKLLQLLPESQKCYMMLSSWIVVMKKNLMPITNEAKILFIYSFPQIQDYIYHGCYDFDAITLKDLKIFSRLL